MNKFRPKGEENKRAFTMVEVMLVLFISATIFVGVVPLMAKATTANKAAKLRLLAYEDARVEVENMRGTPVSTLTSHTFAVNDIAGATGTVTVNKNVYGGTEADFAAVKSKVTWTFKGKSESAEVNTYLYAE